MPKIKSCAACGCEFMGERRSKYCLPCGKAIVLARNREYYYRNQEQLLAKKREKYRADPKKFTARSSACNMKRRQRLQ